MPGGSLHAEAGPKPKLNYRSCEKKEEKGKFSPCSLRSSGLNPHNQLDEHCISGIPEETTGVLEIEAVDFGSNCRLGVCFLRLICFWFLCLFYLVFSACYLWWICLLVWLLSFFNLIFFCFLFSIYIYCFLFSLFVSVYVYVLLRDFSCLGLLLPFVLGF